MVLGLGGGGATFVFVRGRQSTAVVTIGGAQESELVKLTPVALQSASPGSVMTTPIPPATTTTTDTPGAPDLDALGKTEAAREEQANVDAKQAEDNILSVASFVEEVQPAGERHTITDLHAMNVKELRGAQLSIKYRFVLTATSDVLSVLGRVVLGMSRVCRASRCRAGSARRCA
eukprot:SAG25_NODE_862_length_5023_cov_2.854010_3_plen_175_part_00